MRLLLASCLILLFSTCSNLANAQTNSLWTGSAGNGSYSDAGNWTNGVPVGNYNAFIDGGSLNASIVNLDMDASVTNLDVSSNDTFNVINGFRFAVAGNSIHNDGAINFNSSALEIASANTNLTGGLLNQMTLNEASSPGRSLIVP